MNPGPPPITPIDELRIPQWIRQRVGIHTFQDIDSAMRIREQNALNRRLVRKQQDGTLGTPDTTEETDTGNVNIGDQITYVVTPPTPTVPTALNTDGQPVAIEPTDKGISPLWVILPILLTLILGGVLLYFLLRDRDGSPTPTPSNPPEYIDHNSKYGIEFTDPINP